MAMAVCPGRFARMDSKRRLRRNESTVQPISISKVHCIRGAVRKAWFVLPVHEHLGRECVAVSNNAAWLMHLLGGVRNAMHHRGAVANFVKECAEAFAKASSQAALPMEEAPPPLMDQASNQGAACKRGRSRILDSEDEEDCVVPAAASSHEQVKPKRRASRRPRRTRRGEWMTLEIRGFVLTFTVLAGPKILVPMENPSIQKIVDDLLPRKGEAKASGRVHDGVKEHLTDEDNGRILWRAETRSTPGFWTIRYVDADGVRVSTAAGLRVPLVSLAGERLSAEEYLRAALQVPRRARREWNRLDQSGANRYLQ